MNFIGMCGEENIENLGAYHYICDKAKRGLFGYKEPTMVCNGCEFYGKENSESAKEETCKNVQESQDKVNQNLCDMVSKLYAELYQAKQDIGALLWLNGNCEYCANGQVEKYCGAERWTCKIGDGSNCRPVWRGVVKESDEE